jgi:hypothetical protein
MNHLVLNKVLWSIISFLTFIVAVAGLKTPQIYNNLISENLIAASFAQDILSIGVCLLLFYLIFTTQKSDTKKQLIITGVVASLGYLYAIFSIEQVYNQLYFVYLAIFSLSFFSVVYSLASLQDVYNKAWRMGTQIKYTTIVFSLSIAFLFSYLWVSTLIPLIQTKDQIAHLYSIYILDLCFVMPGFAITAILSLKNQPFGLLASPVMYILGIFVIFPLGLGELAKPYFGQEVDIKSMVMSFALSGAFMILGSLQLTYLKQS